MANGTYAYQNRAKMAIDSKLFPQMPFENQLWVTAGADRNIRAQVFGANSIGQYSGLSGLQNLLMRATQEPGLEEKSRRVIVMEDIDARHAELLGVRLNIPPEFFFAHCSPFLNLRVVEKSCNVQHGQYWRVPTIQKRNRPCLSDDQGGKWFLESGFFSREEIFVDYPTVAGAFDFLGHVSYWATKYGSESWTVLILLDPHATIMRSEKNPKDEMPLGPANYLRRLNAEVLPSATEHPLIQSEDRSLYNSLVTAHETSYIEYTSNPLSATVCIRNLVRATWEEYAWREEWRVNDTFLQDLSDHRNDEGLGVVELAKAMKNQTANNYQQIINFRRSVKSRRTQLKNMVQAFSLDDVNLYTGREESETMKLSVEREQRLWKQLGDRLVAVDTSLMHYMEEYAQRAAMEERFQASLQAYSAERQARSAGQLTKIATIIVPCTFVASIFSMGGSFAAGEDLFYVYWAISVPVTIALLAWVLHNDIRKFWKDVRSKEWWDLQKTRYVPKRMRSHPDDLESGKKGS